MIKKILFGMFLSIATFAIGCSKVHEEHKAKVAEAIKKEITKTEKEENAEIRTNLALLSKDDRVLAEAQKYCAINSESLLGSMGKPEKIELDGQPVFLCCTHCEKEAKDNPKKTLEHVAELKAKK